MTIVPRVARLGSLAVAVFALCGCLDAPAQSIAPTASPTPEPTPVTTTYQLDQTVWYEGLVIHLDSVVASLDQRGGPVEVRIRFENPGADETQLAAPVLLEVDASSKAPPLAPSRDSKIPSVPAHSFAAAVLTYELQETPSVERAVVLIGEAPSHVARIPLRPAGGDPLRLEPVAVKVSGAGAAGDLRITLRSGVLRWDLPDWSQELGADVEAVTLTYDVAFAGSFSGGFAFTGDNVGLRLPDGTIIEPRRDGHSQSIELIGAGQTKKGLLSRFEIPNGLTGKFALVVRNGSAAKAIPFTIKT